MGIFVRIKKVFEFLFYLFYNYFESAGMLARGRKKSFMKAVLVCTDIRLWQSKIYSADALFILQFFSARFLVGGPVVIQQRECVKTTGVILSYDFLNPLTVNFFDGFCLIKRKRERK